MGIIRLLRMRSVDMIVRKRRRALLRVERFDFGHDRAAALFPDRADVALAIDEEFGVGPRREQLIRRDDVGGAVGHDREQRRRYGAELADRVAWRVRGYRDHLDAGDPE